MANGASTSSTMQITTTQPTSLPFAIQITTSPAPVPVAPLIVWASAQVVVAIIALAITTALSTATYYNARRQRRVAEQSRALAEEKLRLDMFDRRLAVYQHAVNAIGAHYKHPSSPLPSEKIQQLFDDIHVAKFLYGEDVGQFIAILAGRCAERHNVFHAQGEYEDMPDAQRAGKAEEWRLLIYGSLDQLHKIFPPYLDFADVATRPADLTN